MPWPYLAVLVGLATYSQSTSQPWWRIAAHVVEHRKVQVGSSVLGDLHVTSPEITGGCGGEGGFGAQPDGGRLQSCQEAIRQEVQVVPDKQANLTQAPGWGGRDTSV